MVDTDTDPKAAFPEADVIATPPERPEPTPRRSVFLPLLLGGALAAGAGFGLAQFVPDGWPVESTTDLRQELAQQTAALGAAEAELTRLSTALAAVEARAQPDPTLPDRVAALESAPSAVAGYDDSALAARLATVEDQLAQIATLPADGSSASPAVLAAQAAAITALQAELAALKVGSSTGDAAAITAAATEAEARMAAAEARAAQTLVQANLAQIGIAMDTGAPFDGLLAALDPATIPAVLGDNAATGLPTLADLQTSFPIAAGAAIDASLRADMGDGWTDRMTNFLRSQTGARSLSPREGDDPDAILSRAEAALQTGNITDAVALIKTLPDAGKAAMSQWVASATLHQEAQQALVQLMQTIGGQE